MPCSLDQIGDRDAAEREHASTRAAEIRPDRRVECVQVRRRTRGMRFRQHVGVPRPGRVGGPAHRPTWLDPFLVPFTCAPER